MSVKDVQLAVQAVLSWLDDPPGEAVVRQCIVLRLLQAAGFDIWNPAEVVPEETNTAGRRSDFLVRRGAGRFALEIKGMAASLSTREYEQAVTYAVNEGSRWAIVTNGRKWVVLDEHLPGRYEERAALTLEMGQESDMFGEDLAAVLDTATWERNAFAETVSTLKARQQQRRDEARICREKTPVVLEVQTRYQIPTFELAADAAARMGQITEVERDVLLGRGAERRENAEGIEFTFAVAGARASAVFNRVKGTWTVRAGSTAAYRLLAEGSNTRSLEKRREQMLAEGILEELSPTLLRFTRDHAYTSPSLAAVDIAGGSRNGWDVWRDAAGRPAQEYRN